MSASSWQFASPPPRPRRPDVMLFVFGKGPLADDVPLSPVRFGAPSEQALALCDVRSVPRSADVAWFDAWRSGAIRAIAAQDLGGAIDLLDAADYVHVIACDPGDVHDLAYLQSAWAMARYVAARGGNVVLDAHAMTFIAAAKLPAPDMPLDTAREVRVVYETDSRRADLAHAIHTRGLRKFGAPDLVALITDADVPLVAHAMRELADHVARGRDLATPTHAVEVAAGVHWIVVEDEHRLGSLLQVNNEARVIVDERGHDLVGVMGRIPHPVTS